MDTNYAVHTTPRFRVLAKPQIKRVFRATLECLQRTGVNVYNEEARDLLVAAGARSNGIRVRIPAHIIQDAISAAPRSFSIWGRNRRSRMQIVPDRVYFGPGPTCTYYIDPQTGERRLARRGDAALTAQVCDNLQNIDYVMGLSLLSDVHPKRAAVYEFAELIANTGKPIVCWANTLENIADIYDIALAVAGDEDTFQQYPSFALFTTFHSPLQHTNTELANAMWAVEHGIPVVYMGGGTAGTTAPITGAGLFVIYLAGALSGLAVLQLKQRGAKVCLGGIPQAMDLHTAVPAYGSPETSLYGAALSDISRYLDIPFMGTAGITESKVLDTQAAIENAIQVILSGLSGATLVHDVGMLDSADTGSLELLVMNDEVIAMTRRILRGIEVSDDTLMLDLIDEIGPGGHFMSAQETAIRCRHEIWVPGLMDRQLRSHWQDTGELTMRDRIKIRLDHILATHVPPALPPGAAEKIQAILEALEQRPLSG